MIRSPHQDAVRTTLEQLLNFLVPQIADRAAVRDAEDRIGRALDDREYEALVETRRDARPRWMAFETALRSRAPELAELLLHHPPRGATRTARRTLDAL